MSDPVQGPDGQTYERSAITEWLRVKGTSPITREPMRVDQLVTNFTVKRIIAELSDTPSPARAPVYAPTVQISATTRHSDRMTQVTLNAPDGEVGHIDCMFVVDVSGSMSTEVTSTTGESDGFCILDVVKHAVQTCIKGLRPGDKAGIVAYSSQARVVLPMTAMTESGRALASAAAKNLLTEGSTNIWAGLRLAMEQLQDGGTVFLLTDGQPNISPPKGELRMLREYLDSRDDIVVNSYGFGYALNSELLANLSSETRGPYSFIPDIGMVGTVFVHAMANLRVTVPTSLTVAIETDDDDLDLPGATKTSWGYSLAVGRIAFGQRRDIFIESDLQVDVSILDIDIEKSSELPDQPFRQQVALGIMECFQLMSAGQAAAADACLKALIVATPESPLQQDLTGQVAEALEPTAFHKWGRHYLPALAGAHWSQICINFKDHGLQENGGPTFQRLRDELDRVFNEMPAPKPSLRRQVEQRSRRNGTTMSASPIRMSTYNQRGGGCFAGHCRVAMTDGSRKPLRELVSGDCVKTPQGSCLVRCMMKSLCENARTSLVSIGGLEVTPWHPIRITDGWVFPMRMGKAVNKECVAVWSFLLEPGHTSLFIEDIECIALAHGIEDGIAAHPFYGTGRVIEAMRTLDNFDNGQVTVRGVVRHSENRLVCGLTQ